MRAPLETTLRLAFQKPAHGVLSLWLTHLLVLLVLAMAIAATALIALRQSNWPELLRRLAVAQFQMSLSAMSRWGMWISIRVDGHRSPIYTSWMSRAAHRPLFSVRQVAIRFDAAAVVGVSRLCR